MSNISCARENKDYLALLLMVKAIKNWMHYMSRLQIYSQGILLTKTYFILTVVKIKPSSKMYNAAKYKKKIFLLISNRTSVWI